ncbi:hypothetical protein EMPG_15597 [Blastomyces silverae]|uniref:Uncharacterized protein n=1 Tax=Blastomyces silverae TaxID=2060906 RepID=A0A0H1BCA2_9EURO|nr:hypothetical protein EMPG_15597 [Blastomyces silverae]
MSSIFRMAIPVAEEQAENLCPKPFIVRHVGKDLRGGVISPGMSGSIVESDLTYATGRAVGSNSSSVLH